MEINKNRRGFTLLEVVLTMILISTLSVGVAIGFSSYIEKGNRAGIITDFNFTFLNPVRLVVISNGKLPDLNYIKESAIESGFVSYTGVNWVVPLVEENNKVLGVEKGIKRYELSLLTSDSGEKFIRIRADHSKTGHYVDFYLDDMRQDVIVFESE